MPAERSSNSEAAGLPDVAGHAKQLRRLALFLRQTREFRLAAALYNDPVVRDQLVRESSAELASDGVRVIKLDLREVTSERTFLARIEAVLKDEDRQQPLAVMVVNFDARIDYTPETARPGGPGLEFLETANLHRSLFAAACPAPLVIWMTELLENAWVRHAPDLWRWRSHVFDLRVAHSGDARIEGVNSQNLSSNDDRLHPEDRLRRLTEELADYRKLAKNGLKEARLDELRTLNSIGLARLDAGDARLARRDFEAALIIAREIGDRRGEGNAFWNSALCLWELGKSVEAITRAVAALAILEVIEDPSAAKVRASLANWRDGGL